MKHDTLIIIIKCHMYHARTPTVYNIFYLELES